MGHILRPMLGSFFLLCCILTVSAQHTGYSYRLTNETGRCRLTSYTFSHRPDNQKGLTVVTDRSDRDTLYVIHQFLNGWTALSNDGRTVAHLVAERNGKPLDRAELTMYRDGKVFNTAQLARLIQYQLKEETENGLIPKSGWIKNDSLLHKMASNPFYITDDKLFISFEGPKLMVFDMNTMLHIFTGNGANHFFQNYYAIPDPPHRTTYSTKEYIPESLPSTRSGHPFSATLEALSGHELSTPEEAEYRAEILFKLDRNGSVTENETTIFDTRTDTPNAEETEKIRNGLNRTLFAPESIPPGHPAWIFARTLWLK